MTRGYFVPPAFFVECGKCGKTVDLCSTPEGRKQDLGDRYECIRCQDASK